MEQIVRNNKKLKEFLAKIPKETMDRVKKQMSCKWLRYGDECGKGLPGTPCGVTGCVAWEEYENE